MDADVIVAGAGPAGLLLAGELGLAGVTTLVLDRLPRRTGRSKALNLQPRSAEILDLRGLLDPLLDRATDRLPAGHFAGLSVPLDYSSLDTRHPYQIGIPQARVEAALDDRLTRHAVPVLREHMLTGVDQDADGVTVTAAGPGGEVRLRARYLAGCDGGRSTVRKLLDVPFPGRDPRMSAVVADVELTDPAGTVPAEWSLPSLDARDGGVATVLPLDDGVHRMLFAGPEQQAADRAAPVTEDEVRRALEHAYEDGPRLRRIRWASRFTDASRQAERYRTGRVLLAGDAAHIHSPTGGQGLNLGLQDAFNLGWKLAAQVRGTAPDGLLDSYHDERHPVAARVLANTRAQGVLMVPDGDVTALRGVLTDLLALPDTNRHLAGMISGLDIRYAPPDGTGHPLLGRRMPDLDLRTPDGPTRFSRLMHTGRGLYLTFGTPDPAAGAYPHIDHVTARPTSHPGLAGVTALLIRPDGHICQVAPTGAPAALGPAVSRWIGSTGPPAPAVP